MKSLVLASLFVSQLAFGAAAIFSGTDVKILKGNLDMNGSEKIITGSTDPTTAGISANKGSLYLNTTSGYFYRKLDAGSSTNWIKVGSAPFTQENLIRNGDFEYDSGGTAWTASGGTFTTSTSAANVGSGVRSGDWDSNSASQTLTSDAFAIPAGLYAQNGVASCNIKTPTGTATHLIQAYDGTNVLSSATITSTTTYSRSSVNFIFPSSNNIQLRIVSVASNEPEIFIDDCYIGNATNYNLSNINQAQFIGSAYIAPTSSCTWSRTNTALGIPSTTSACPGPTVLQNPGPGTIQTTDTDLPQFTVNNLPAGRFIVIITVAAGMSSGSNHVGMAINDGTTTTGNSEQFVTQGTVNSGRTLVGDYVYTTPGNHTFSVWTSASANAVAIQNATSPDYQTEFHIYMLPNSAQLAYTPDKVANSWSGYHNNTCSWAVTNTSYTDFTDDASCALVERVNNNFGTVATSGNVSPAITFSPSRAGTYKVTVKGTVSDATLAKLVALKLTDGTTTIDEVDFTQAVSGDGTEFVLSGLYKAASTNAVTLKIQGQSDSGAVTMVSNGRSAQTLSWVLSQVDQQIPAPLLVNSVVSSLNGVEKIERANMLCSSASAINSQTGGFTSIGNISSGKCSVVIPASQWSSTAYDCVATANGTATTVITGININNKTSTGFDIYFALIGTGSSTIAAASTATFDIICSGPK